jgi:hypothetical protein
MNLKRITDLNVNYRRLKLHRGSFFFIPALKLQFENIGKTLVDIGKGNYFLNATPIAQAIRTQISKKNCIK